MAFGSTTVGSRGLLRVDLEAYGALQLVDDCRPILKGEQSLYLRKGRLQSACCETNSLLSKTEVKPEHKQLFEALRLS